MQFEVGSHLGDGDLEQYSMGRLADIGLARFEEHVLACQSCQDRLLEMEDFVNAVRRVSLKLRAASHSRSRDRFFGKRRAYAMGVVAVGFRADLAVSAEAIHRFRCGSSAHSRGGIKGWSSPRPRLESLLLSPSI